MHGVDLAAGAAEMARRRADADLDARRVTERAIQRCRGWCVVIGAAQTAIYSGDRAWAGWTALALMATTWLGTEVALRRAPGAVGRIGVLSMAADSTVIVVLLANLLRDPTDPIQMLPLLLAAEGALRWGRTGGIAAGVGGGLLTAGWSVAVHAVNDIALPPAFVTFRFAMVAMLGVLLGATVSAVRAQRRLASLVCDGSSDLIASFDPSGRILSVNPACRAVLGYPQEEMVGRDRTDFLAPGQRHLLAPGARAAARREVCFLHREGHEVWIELDLQHDPEQGLLYAIGRDVTARRRAEDDLRHRVEHDALTGAANRAHLMGRMAREMRHPRRMFLLFVDLDGFKLVNDAHGHGAGDAVLVEAVDRLRGCVRPQDLVVRLAGDELCVLMPGPVSEAEAQGAAGAVRDAVARPFRHCREDIRVTASVGVAGSLPSDRPSDLLERADQAMYAQKRAQRELAAAP